MMPVMEYKVVISVKKSIAKGAGAVWVDSHKGTLLWPPSKATPALTLSGLLLFPATCSRQHHQPEPVL